MPWCSVSIDETVVGTVYVEPTLLKPSGYKQVLLIFLTNS